jgi:probable HAF family extracellular repeat protein
MVRISLLALLSAASVATDAAQLYRVTDLSSQIPFSIEDLEINTSGQLAGIAQTGASKTLAFRWDAGSMTPLPALQGFGRSYAYGINESNQIVGQRAKCLSSWASCDALGWDYYVSKPIKGAIGEAMTWVDLTLSGRSVAGTHVSNGVGKSTFDFVTTAGTFVESKFGTSTLSTPQRKAASQLGSAFELQRWDYDTFSGIVDSSFLAGVAEADDGSAAAGGFVLYPNKTNTNQVNAVYSK